METRWTRIGARRTTSGRALAMAALLSALAGCGAPGAMFGFADATKAAPTLQPGETAEMRGLIDHYADLYGVPRPLVHRIVKRESTYNPGARNGQYMGLMQIMPQTARRMGYEGDAHGLLDAETNLRFGVKYLRGAWLLADGSADTAERWYSRGYYYEAKRRGMLVETGLRGS